MEAKIKHLEFIQAIISRMAHNSFLIKGWCVTIISAFYALAAKDARIGYIIVSYMALICFWILDGFFIAAERRYRKLYMDAAKCAKENVDFNLDASIYNKDDAKWISGVFSQTLMVFYPFIIIIGIIIMCTLPIIVHK